MAMIGVACWQYGVEHNDVIKLLVRCDLDYANGLEIC